MGFSGNGPQSYRQSLDQINQGQDAKGEEKLIPSLVKDPATVATAATLPVTGPILGAARATGMGLGGRLALKAGAGAVDQKAKHSSVLQGRM